MAFHIDLSKFSDTVRRLLEPFKPGVEVKSRLRNPNAPEGPYNKRFSYVQPENYRIRLMDVYGDEYGFEMHDYQIGKTDGIFAIATLTQPNGKKKSVGVWEDYTKQADTVWDNDTRARVPNPKAGEIINRSETFAMLASAGIKAVGRECGVALHVYFEKDDQGQPAPAPATQAAPAASSAPAAAPAASSGPWDGSELITFGNKYKGQPWSAADDSWVNFLIDDARAKGKTPNAKAVQEQARRQATAGATGAAGAAAANAEQDPNDDEFPF